MLSSSLIALLAASTFVNGLPTWYKRQLHGVADLGALTSDLGTIPGLDVLTDVPGAVSPQANAVVAPPADSGEQAAGGGRRTKANQASGAAGQRQKGTNKKGNKHANGNAGTGNADVGLGANTTLAEGETGIANGTAVETGLAVNSTALVGETGADNSTAVATEAPGNVTATGEIGAGAGASTVTVTVTVTEVAGAANTTAVEGAGLTSTDLSATVTSPPVASSTSVSTVADGAQTDIASLSDPLPTPSPIQTPVSPEQGAGGGHDQASADSVDDEEVD